MISQRYLPAVLTIVTILVITVVWYFTGGISGGTVNRYFSFKTQLITIEGINATAPSVRCLNMRSREDVRAHDQQGVLNIHKTLPQNAIYAVETNTHISCLGTGRVGFGVDEAALVSTLVTVEAAETGISNVVSSRNVHELIAPVTAIRATGSSLATSQEGQTLPYDWHFNVPVGTGTGSLTIYWRSIRSTNAKDLIVVENALKKDLFATVDLKDLGVDANHVELTDVERVATYVISQ